MHQINLADAGVGQNPIGEVRFATHDIRLSSALCALGFSLKLESQPVGVTIDADSECKIVTFFHEDKTDLGNFTARAVQLWWNSPLGKYEIQGYDDALEAMRRVHRERARMIAIAKSPRSYQSRNGSVGTKSIHTASILAACEIKLAGYETSTRRWIFAKGAEVIADFIKAGGKPKERPMENDLCIDWMLEALRFRDWLAKLVRDPENIPLMSMRDGEKVLQISSAMDEREQRKWISYL
jgi:hypothetical protein